ncbi:MAG: hypothetical protein WB586_19445 [Chthoniobacterales bacterium]
MKQAILATVVSVKKQCPDSVAVRLESEELNEATVIVSTGLACERTHNKSPGYGLDVTCKGDPFFSDSIVTLFAPRSASGLLPVGLRTV